MNIQTDSLVFQNCVVFIYILGLYELFVFVKSVRGTSHVKPVYENEHIGTFHVKKIGGLLKIFKHILFQFEML